MQFRNFFILITICFFSLLSTTSFAQQVMTNDSGDLIILYPDGSWKYLDKNNPDHVKLLNKGTEQNTTSNPKTKKAKKAKKPKVKKPTTKKSKTAKAKKPKTKKPKTKKTKTAKAPKGKKIKTQYSSGEESAARKEAVRRADKLARDERKAVQQENVALQKLNKLEADYEEAVEFEELTEYEELDYKSKIKAAKRTFKNAKRTRKYATKEARKGIKMIDMDKATRDKALAKMYGKKNTPITPSYETDPREDEISLSDPKKIKSKAVGSSSSKTSTFKVLSPEEDVMLNPPKPPCQFIYDGVDDFTGKKRRDVATSVMFTHTSDKLRPYFKDREYITCEGHLSSLSGGIQMLSLKFVIASEHAQKEFGALGQGSMLTFKTIDGDSVKLVNKRTDPGTYDPLNKEVTYEAQYLLSNGNQKDLSKREIDKVRVVWSTGYEDYEIFNVDFFINQFNCLNSK